MEERAAPRPQPALRKEDPLVGQNIGSYRVVRKLGEGGMGAVFEAVHEQIGKRAAIKVLHAEFSKDPEFARRFINEARAVNIVQHNGLVSIFDFGQLPSGIAYIVMDYLDGETLSGRMKRMGGKLGLDALNIARQIASALAAAHGKGIIHRDLKPANIIIVSEPEAPGGERAKVLDFGVAKMAKDAQGGPADEHHPVTRTGVFMGTPKYMAPEQCKGAGHVDDKADVYSLGAMLYQMLAGRPPFVAPGEGEIMAMHIFATPKPLRDLEPTVSEELAALVHHMLAKDPAERPSMSDVARELGRLSGAMTGAFAALNLSSALSVGSLNLSSALPLTQGGLAPITLSGGVPVLHPAAPGTGPASSPGALLASGATPSSPSRQAQVPSGLTPSLQVVDGMRPEAAGTLRDAPVHAQASADSHDRSVGHDINRGATKRRVLLALLLLPLFIGSVAAVALIGRPKPPPPPVQVQQPVIAAPKETPPAQRERRVRWSITTTPPGAEVVREADGQVLGRTPLSQRRKAEQGEETLLLRLAGHKDLRVVVALDKDEERSEVFVAEPAPAAEPGKGKKRGRGKHHIPDKDIDDDDIPLVK
jgi:serine/threonine-protein kinase